jgi:hypothetical protein
MHRFSNTLLPQIIDSYIVVIDMILSRTQQEGGPSHVLLCRFDVVYAQPVIQMNIQMSKVNIAFRDLYRQWVKQKKVSDLFFFFPVQHLAPFRKALEISCTSETAEYSTHDSTTCPGHFIYPALAQSLGAGSIHFIDEGYWSSNLNATDYETKSSSSWTQLPFLAISRVCGSWSSSDLIDSNRNYSCRVPRFSIGNSQHNVNPKPKKKHKQKNNHGRTAC